MKGKKTVGAKGVKENTSAGGQKDSSGDAAPPPPPPPTSAPEKGQAKAGGASYSQDDIILMSAMGVLLAIGIALLFLLWREKNKIRSKESELKNLQTQMNDNSKYLDKVVENLENDKTNLEKEKSNKESALRVMEREIKQLNERCRELEIQLGKAKECCCKLTKETERIKQAKFGCDLMANQMNNEMYQKHQLQKKLERERERERVRERDMDRERHCRPRCGEDQCPCPGPVLDGGAYVCSPNYTMQGKHYPQDARYSGNKEKKSRFKSRSSQRPQSSTRKEANREVETQQTTSLTDLSDNGSESLTYQSGGNETTDIEERKPSRGSKWRQKSPEKSSRRSTKSEKNTKWQYLFLD